MINGFVHGPRKFPGLLRNRPLFELEFGVLVFEFVKGGNLENLKQNPWRKARANNKLNPHIYGIMARPE